MSDLIEREQALALAKEEYFPCDGGCYTRSYINADDIRRLPSIETIYGYHFNELAFVASILAKEGISPTELIRIIWDAERIAEILCKEIKDNFQKAMKGYMEGVEDE